MFAHRAMSTDHHVSLMVTYVSAAHSRSSSTMNDVMVEICSLHVVEETQRIALNKRRNMEGNRDSLCDKGVGYVSGRFCGVTMCQKHNFYTTDLCDRGNPHTYAS